MAGSSHGKSSGRSSPQSHLFCATLMTVERSWDAVSSKATAPRLARRGRQREPPASATACEPGLEVAGRIFPYGRENLAVDVQVIRLPAPQSRSLTTFRDEQSQVHSHSVKPETCVRGIVFTTSARE